MKRVLNTASSFLIRRERQLQDRQVRVWRVRRVWGREPAQPPPRVPHAGQAGDAPRHAACITRGAAQARVEHRRQVIQYASFSGFGHSLNFCDPFHRSYNIFVKDDDKLTFHRHPVAQSTDCIRGKVGYERGIHVFEINWSTRQRGTHAVVGVSTGKLASLPLTSLYIAKLKCLLFFRS